MENNHYDVIVIGAGMAGLCCAGELVLGGIRVLLISETKEVGFAIRSRNVEGNLGIMQVPTYMVGWGGGWWPKLARQLNVDIQVPLGFNCAGFDLAVEGTGEVRPIPQAAITGAALNSMLAEMAGTINPDFKQAFNADSEKVLSNALNIPYQELMLMDRILMTDWLKEQNASEMLSQILFMMAAAFYGSTAKFCQEQASVYGMIGVIRAGFCGEATFGWVKPDNRQGMAVPLAKGIEAHGGTIIRGQKVARLDTSGGKIDTVMLSDGSEYKAPMIALACGNPRISALLDPIPPELIEPFDYANNVLPHKDYHLLTVLDKPVLPSTLKNWVGVLSQDGTLTALLNPVHATASWAVQPGKQFLSTACFLPADEVAEGKYGTEDEIFARMADTVESFYPGFKDAIGASERLSHKPGHLWYSHMCAGPKLPRTIESVKGLWFVGEGSTPTCGLYMEGAASAGILGARSIIEAQKNL